MNESRTLNVLELCAPLRETVLWARHLGWRMVDAWADTTWDDQPGGVDHTVKLRNDDRQAEALLIAAGVGGDTLCFGGVKMRTPNGIVSRRMSNLGEIAVGLLEHGCVDLRDAS